MDTLKFDAPLAAAIAKLAAHADQPLLDLSVRMRAPLAPEHAAELGAIGVEGASPGRRVCSARLSPSALRAVAAKPWVLHVSLAQLLRPLSRDEAE